MGSTGMSALDMRNVVGVAHGVPYSVPSQPVVASPVSPPEAPFPTASRPPSRNSQDSKNLGGQGWGGQSQPQPQSSERPQSTGSLASSPVAAFLAQSLGQDMPYQASSSLPGAPGRAAAAYATASGVSRESTGASGSFGAANSFGTTSSGATTSGTATSGTIEILAPYSVLSSGKAIDLSV